MMLHFRKSLWPISQEISGETQGQVWETPITILSTFYKKVEVSLSRELNERLIDYSRWLGLLWRIQYLQRTHNFTEQRLYPLWITIGVLIHQVYSLLRILCRIPLFRENRFANISKLILFHMCYGSYLSVKWTGVSNGTGCITRKVINTKPIPV